MDRRKFLKILGAGIAVAAVPIPLKLFAKEIPSRPSAPSIPTGYIMPYAGRDIPKGWLLCDGSPISKQGHPALYEALAVLGTGSVPDLKASWIPWRKPKFKFPDNKGMYLQYIIKE